MAVRFVSNPSVADWDERIAANPDGGNMFQSHELGEIKRLSKWEPIYADVDGVAVTIHAKRAPGFGTYWYLPKGPCAGSVERLAEVMPQLAEAGKRHHVFVIKIEPELLETPENIAALEAGGLRRVHAVQPNVSTIFIDLTGTHDELHQRMPSKQRYAFRRAERDGVVAEAVDGTPENLHTMWSLWKLVIDDNELSLRGEAYYTAFWREFLDAGHGQLFFAHTDDTVVAAAFATLIGTKATYKDGGSLRDRPAYGASELLQWRMMEWAQANGAVSYDLCGTPHSTQAENPDDPYYGIGRFKRSFSKDITDFVGAWDLPLHPRLYELWNRGGMRVVQKLRSGGTGDGWF